MEIILNVKKQSERWSSICQATIPEHYEGFTSALTFGGNTTLAGEEIRFDGFSREQVVAFVLEALKERGLHGVLKVRGDK